MAKLWHAGFSYVQTSSKPCSNLPDHASRCDTILKESSINFLFLRAATVDFLRCLELRFDWGSESTKCDSTVPQVAKDTGNMEIYTPVHISCMCYVSGLCVTGWLQHDVRDGLFVHSA